MSLEGRQWCWPLRSFHFFSKVRYPMRHREKKSMLGGYWFQQFIIFQEELYFVSRNSLEGGRGNEESGKVQDFTTRLFVDNRNLDNVVLLFYF